MMDSFWISLGVALIALKDCLALLAVLFVGRYFYRLTTNVKLEEEIAVKDNTAMGVAVAGYLVGLGIASSGGLLTAGEGSDKAIMIALVGLVAMVLLRISLLINDKLILTKFNNLKEIVTDRNLGVAFVEAGECVATGLMINGVMSGKAESLQEKLLYGLIYWAIGQVILVAGSQLFHLFCGFAVDAELEKDNTAPGIAFGGFMVAIGLIVQAALKGVSTDVVPELATIAVFAIIGFILLIAGKLALAKILMPTSPISREISTEKNCGAGALSAVGYIAIAVIFAASISPATTYAAFESPTAEPADAVAIQPVAAPAAPTPTDNNINKEPDGAGAKAQ